MKTSAISNIGHRTDRSQHNPYFPRKFSHARSSRASDTQLLHHTQPGGYCRGSSVY
jgi:hypothetical protein